MSRVRWVLATLLWAAVAAAVTVVEPATATFVDSDPVGANTFTTGTWSSGPATLTALADTTLKKGSAAKNFGTDTGMSVSKNQRALISFDPTQLADAVAGETLTSATLRLYRQTSTTGWGTSGRTVDVHRLLAAWTETGVTWNCPNDTDTSNSQNDCPLQWGGGAFDPVATASVVHLNSVTGWVEWDVTADVATMIGIPAANYGWVLKKTDETATGQADYTTKEGAANQPQLVLTFA